MKPAIWRIFRNGRWSYSDSPSTRSEDRAAWQPLYAATPKCERCGEVNPAEIHTCTPKQEEGCAECGKKSSDGWALYCVKCSEPLIDGWPLYSGLPQPEPIGWIYEDDEGRMIFSQMPYPDPLWEPVYRAAPKREWQGLTDEEIKNLLWETRVDNLTFARVIEKVLREKNAA